MFFGHPDLRREGEVRPADVLFEDELWNDSFEDQFQGRGAKTALERVKRMRMLSSISGTSEYIAVLFTENAPPQLYAGETNDLHPLALTFDEYVVTMLAARGLQGWWRSYLERGGARERRRAQTEAREALRRCWAEAFPASLHLRGRE